MSKKTWRIVLIAYLLVFVLCVGIKWPGIERGQLSPLDSLLVAPPCFGFAIYGVQYGYVQGRFFYFTRAANPIAFWLSIGGWCLLGFAVLLTGGYGIVKSI